MPCLSIKGTGAIGSDVHKVFLSFPGAILFGEAEGESLPEDETLGLLHNRQSILPGSSLPRLSCDSKRDVRMIAHDMQML